MALKAIQAAGSLYKAKVDKIKADTDYKIAAGRIHYKLLIQEVTDK